MKKYLLLLVIALSYSSCGCGDHAEEDEVIIMNYLNDNNLNFESTSEGIYYSIGVPGNTEMPNINSKVTVNYKGYFLDGSVFDENDDISFALFGVIVGWQKAIPLLGKGGSGTFIIPSRYAYGCDGNSSIPGNSVLAFDVTLIDFE